MATDIVSFVKLVKMQSEDNEVWAMCTYCKEAYEVSKQFPTFYLEVPRGTAYYCGADCLLKSPSRIANPDGTVYRIDENVFLD